MKLQNTFKSLKYLLSNKIYITYFKLILVKICRYKMTQKHFLFKSNAFLVRVVETSQRRTIFKPPRNTPYFGIYRTNGEICRKDDILVSQRNLNYHPGANVSWQPYCGQHLLKANCDGTVMITREKCEPNPEMEIMQENYASRNYENIFKLTFNVIPRRMSKRFTLIDEE